MQPDGRKDVGLENLYREGRKGTGNVTEIVDSGNDTG